MNSTAWHDGLPQLSITPKQRAPLVELSMEQSVHLVLDRFVLERGCGAPALSFQMLVAALWQIGRAHV